jgi:hypothetical protein
LFLAKGGSLFLFDSRPHAAPLICKGAAFNFYVRRAVFSGKTGTWPSQFRFRPPEKEKTTTKYIQPILRLAPSQIAKRHRNNSGKNRKAWM